MKNHFDISDSIDMTPGRFAQKPVPPGTIRLGRFAQNFERDNSLKITGTVRSKFNLLGQFTLSNFQKEKKNEVEFHLFLNEQFYLLVLNIINVEKENTVYMYKLTGQAGHN